MTKAEHDTIMDALHAVGKHGDNAPLAETALLFAALDHPGITLDRYKHHIERLSEDCARRYEELVSAGANEVVETRLGALKHVLVDLHDYRGDEQDLSDFRNLDLIEVIDRRKGASLTLSVLYADVARSQGWDANILALPSYYIVRMDYEGMRLLFDPAQECKILHAPDLRQLVKKVLGDNAELSADYFAPVSPREALVQLQNRIKLKRIEGEDYEGAIKVVEALRSFDPQEYRLFLDAGLLYARTDQPQKAIESLEVYIEKTPDPRDRQDAAVLIQQIRQTLK